MTLYGNNTYSGTTTINAGVLQVGNGGTTGTLGLGAVIDNASLIFFRSSATGTITVTNSDQRHWLGDQEQRLHPDAVRHQHLQRRHHYQRGRAHRFRRQSDR